jgi:HD superfamily phosphodiesterase
VTTPTACMNKGDAAGTPSSSARSKNSWPAAKILRRWGENSGVGVEKLTGEAEFKPVRDESSLVRLREGEEREGRRRESSRALTALGRRLSKQP